jgi:dienelactone hydrolase
MVYERNGVVLMKWLRWLALGIVFLIAAGGLSACAFGPLRNVALTPRAQVAEPPALGVFGADPPVTSFADWQTRRAPLLREAFQAEIYGRFPAPRPVSVTARAPLALPGLPDGAAAEQWSVQIGAAAEGIRFSMVLILPPGEGPKPVIVTQNFCGNALAYEGVRGVAPPRFGTPKDCENEAMKPIVTAIFGNAIMTPPLDMILPRGYGVVSIYAGDVAPDDPATAPAELAKLTPPGTPPEQRTGAIAAWAYTYLAATEALSADARIDARRIALWGHSRNGKAALLAAAMDSRPAAVIALQSGTAGASLDRDDVGEGIAEITKSFPHWFSPHFASYGARQSALPIDQHQLIALIAPRPVLIASARRDGWADPQGALLALRGASPVYERMGQPAFSQARLDAWNPALPLAYYIRPGPHGVRRGDWRMALDFLDAQMKPVRDRWLRTGRSMEGESPKVQAPN